MTAPAAQRVDCRRRHRRERRDLRRADDCRAARAGLPPRDRRFSDYGRRLLLDELGPEAKVDRLADLLVERHGDGVAQRHVRAAQQPRFGRHARERQPSAATRW